MSKINVLVCALAAFAGLVQISTGNVISCANNIGNKLALNGAPNGVGAIGNMALGAGNAAFGPGNAAFGAAIAAPAGMGDVSLTGDLPVEGSTSITGSVPVIGYVTFEGIVPAGGIVSVAPGCGCAPISC